MADVNLQVGSDLSEFLSQLNQLKESYVQIRDETKQAKSAMEEAFVAAANGGEAAETQLTSYIKTTRQQAEVIDALTKKLKELEKTKLPDADAKKYTAEIKKLQEEIKKLKDETKKFGDESGNGNRKASAAVQTLLGVLDAAKGKLAELKEGSKAFDTLKGEIDAAELAMATMGNQTADTGDKMETARKQLKDFQVTLQNLKLEGLDNTQVYKDLKNQAGELKDTIGDVQEEIAAVGSDTKGIDNLIRGIQLATNAAGIYEGVVALTGQRNEDFEKTMIRLNAIMTISNSLQAVMAELKRADSVLTTAQIGLQKAYTFVIGTSTGALKAFRIALASTGVGLLVLGLVALIQKMSEWSSSADDAEAAQDRLRKSVDRVSESLQNQTQFIQFTTQKNELLLKKAGATEKELLQNRIAGRNQEIEALREASDARARAYANEIKFLEKGSQEYLQAIDDLNKDQADNRNRQIELANQIELDLLQFEADAAEQRRKNEKTAAEKRAQDRKKSYEDQQKEAEERNKRIAELEKQLTELQLAAMAEGRAKEIAEEQKSYNDRIAALKENLGTAKGKELQLINANIEQATLNHTARLLAIDLQYYQEAQQQLVQLEESLTNEILQGQEAELNAVLKKYQGLNDAIADTQAKLRENIANGIGDPDAQQAQFERLSTAAKTLAEKQGKEINEIKQKFDLQALDQQEKLALAENDLLEMSGVDQKKLEEMKEQAKVDIIIAFARKRIDLLKQIGGEEAELQILQLEKVIQDASKKKENESGQQNDLFALLGLKIDEKTKQDIIAGAKGIFDTITQLFADSVQARIDESERLMEALQEQIDEQEELVDREKELADKGYANNLAVEEKKLADLKRQKAAEAEELKKAQAEQQKFAAIQVAINGVVSASNLAVSAANYFKEGSKLGPIAGTILSLAAIATMISTFIATKKQAQSVAQFRHGGELDLTNQTISHERGGIGLYDGESGKKIAEAEGGEYGYFFRNGRHAKQFEPLFRLINEGKIPQLPELSPVDMGAIGDIPKHIIDRQSVIANGGGKTDAATLNELRAQTGILSKLASKEERTNENGEVVIRKGNHTRRIKKAQ